MNYLQKALSLNASFSSLSGIILIAANRTVSNWFGLDEGLVFALIGAGLLFFSGTIAYQIKHQNTAGILLIIVQDLLWVIASLLLLILQPFEISGLGIGLIEVVGFLVLAMAINQIFALSRTKTGAKELRTLTYERIMKGSQEKTWSVVSDVANYYTVAPNIDGVKILSGEGRGMVRQCSHGKDQWTETCSLWIEGKKYAFEVNTKAPDYPYPFDELQGEWEVDAVSIQTTRVKMIFSFRFRNKLQHGLLYPILKKKFSGVVEELLDNWQDQIGHK
ncbi:SRPBCC family protein [bacterium SCSIO 12741]|nr:SRPBCC family protein [bacterium SCSIO 12741]